MKKSKTLIGKENTVRNPIVATNVLAAAVLLALGVARAYADYSSEPLREMNRLAGAEDVFGSMAHLLVTPDEGLEKRH